MWKKVLAEKSVKQRIKTIPSCITTYGFTFLVMVSFLSETF